MKRYEVYYKGKKTGIITNDKSINIKELRKIIPNAQPYLKIEFKLIKKAT